MIKTEVSAVSKISIKGILVDIDNTEITIEDKKSGEEEKFSLETLKEFVGKTITIAISNKSSDDEEE